MALPLHLLIVKPYSPHQFAIWRILFGLYLLQYFLRILPFGEELFSKNGMLPSADLNRFDIHFPNILRLFDSPEFVSFFIGCLAVVSLCFMFGCWRRLSAVMLCYGWLALLDRNNLIMDPSLFFIAWLLLATAFIPTGEPWSFNTTKEKWQMPSLPYWGAWITLGVGYTGTGIDKLMAPSWWNGSALKLIYTSSIAYDWWLKNFLLQHLWITNLQTWFIAFVQALTLPLMAFRKMRTILWLLLTFLFVIAALFFLDLKDVLIGMLLYHLFIFDSEWFQSREPKEKPIIFFDEVCVLCNGFAKFIFDEDLHELYVFGTLQGQTIKKFTSQLGDNSMKSIILAENGKVYKESEAALRIISNLGGIWRVMEIFRTIPLSIRNSAYRYLARNRYRWFGTTNICSVGQSGEKNRFLD